MVNRGQNSNRKPAIPEKPKDLCIAFRNILKKKETLQNEKEDLISLRTVKKVRWKIT